MFTIRHLTIYRYARPVQIGRHRLMFRPHDSHDLRVLGATLTISPPAASIRWLHDVFGNSVAIAEFAVAAAELRFQSDITLEHYAFEHPNFPIEAYASTYPFSYSNDEIPDLGRMIERHYPDPAHKVDNWAKQFATPEASAPGLLQTQPMLERMMLTIKNSFIYTARYAEGTQTPVETLDLGRGSCRDFSLLMIEAVRSLGFAARFVSGYQYDPAAINNCTANMPSTGATHAWVQIYLPGAGWVEFDPTNAIVGGKNLIRVAVCRDPHQALPLTGEWTGTPADYLGMEVSVIVTASTGQDEAKELAQKNP